MKCSSVKFLALVASLSILPALVSAVPVKRNVDPNLVPDLGFVAGVNPTGTGDCDGAVNGADGKPIKVPCACPPKRDDFIAALNANVNAGVAVNNPSVKLSFPSGSDKDSQLARLEACIITLQNLNGPGKGCPVVSTTLGSQQKAIQDGTASPAPATPAAPAPAPPQAQIPPPASGDAAIAALVPDFGFESGKNPTGTGDCDGAVNGADGKPIKIPCACPPPRDEFVQDLIANVHAGHATNNPTVAVSFPLDDSTASKLARITAASITLQNLHGPGKGCPVVSTTFSAQAKAIQDGSAPPPPAAPAPAPPPAAANPAPTPDSGDAAITALVPDFGFESGKNPTGTGDCDGAVNGADGKPIKIPCACPPPRDEFVNDLIANVHAGHAINNPTVAVSFPLDDSKESKLARITAASITLQNLQGPGKGCPVVSTTFSAQAKAIQGS